jgi:methylated-DNA-protein-cysteine methyltransferase-like protein
MRFTSPPDPSGYQQQVWELVRRVPAGKVVTYGQVAALLPPPHGVEPDAYRSLGPRWVGGAMAACPPDVPWHRVVNAQGKISVRNAAAMQRQEDLLLQEGVAFSPVGRIDLSRHQWQPPEEKNERT